MLYNQTAWSDGGGGATQYAPRPPYQGKIKNIVGATRGVPDVSLVADPNIGVWIYDTIPYKGQVYDWLVIGGTSVASPATAAIFNNAGHFFASTPLELTQVYARRTKKAAYTDITFGPCGNGARGAQTSAEKGWDYCTGIGTSLGTSGK